MSIKHEMSCDICDEIQHGQNNLFAKHLYYQYKKAGLTTRQVFINNHFFLIPSVGPISPCHLLLCPLNHVSSFAQIDQSQMEDIQTILNDVINAVKKEYGYAIAFEHGTSSNNRGSTSCNHAHIHILATKIPLDILLNERGFRLKRINNFSEIHTEFSPNQPYFLIVTNSNHIWITNDHVCTSQYLRLLCTSYLGEGNGLWQNNYNISQMIKISKFLNKYFK